MRPAPTPRAPTRWTRTATAGDLSRLLYDDTRDGVRYERFVRHLGLVLAFYSVPDEFGLDRWLFECRHRESGRSALVRPIHDTPDVYLDQVARVVMDRWCSGRVGVFGDAAFSSSPMSGQGTGLALVGAYLLAGEPADYPDVPHTSAPASGPPTTAPVGS